VPDGFAWWRSGTSDQSSHAFSLAGRDHWDLRDVVAIVSLEHKELGSGSGHAAALSSSVFPARLRELPARLTAVREAILTRDLEALGPLIEEEALSLHAVALTSRPPILYWTGQTVEILRLVRRWRAGGLAVYFTLDAGPNVHLICVGRDAETVAELLADLPFVQRTIVCAPGGPAALVDP
jgi:diphosphomevalonate decarboxylase